MIKNEAQQSGGTCKDGIKKMLVGKRWRERLISSKIKNENSGDYTGIPHHVIQTTNIFLDL